MLNCTIFLLEKRLFRARWLAVVIFVCLLGLPHSAYAWWDADWSDRKKIVVDANAAALKENIGRFPLLVRLHDGNFKFADAKDDGSDLRFVSGDDKTPLKFHLERYDGLLGVALIWVDIPDIHAGATTEIWMYWGNANATPAGDPAGTYDAATSLIYHFGEHSGPPHDATAHANNARNPAVFAEASLIGGGMRLDGHGPWTIPAAPSLATGTEGYTWSVWLKPDAAQANGLVFSAADDDRSFSIGLDQGAPFVNVTNGALISRTAQVAPLAAKSWHHVALTVSDHLSLFVDGQLVSTLAAVLPPLSGAAAIAPVNGGNSGFIGEIDELEISKTTRSAAYIDAAFTSQGQDEKLVTFGADETDSGMSTGYFGVILRSVTPDGWVVIGLLLVMAVVSWVVMVQKAIFINSATKADAKFLAAYADRGAEIEQFRAEINKQAPTLRASALYKIFHEGAEEINRRFERDDGLRERHLSALAIAAIRASLDRVATREAQRLNALMVLLTIAISGGPFLGLLGTVVGVMITFAAIAAAGDVNVNSIAPGIAAALVATVAGLGVAIPALFGYNYLITRIKDLSADMQVFIDEFTTKIAEKFDSENGSQRIAAE